MDKEAQGKIADIIGIGDTDFDKEGGYTPMRDIAMEQASEVLTELIKLGYRKLPEGKPPLISRARAESAVGLTDCSERLYTPEEREDLIRTVIEGAEIQRDADWFDWFKGE